MSGSFELSEFEADLDFSLMTGEERTAAQKLAAWIGRDVPAAIAEYRRRFGAHVSADNARSLEPDWERSEEDRRRLSGALGVPAGKLAHIVYNELVASLKSGQVVFMAGGQGSGKTSAIEDSISKIADIVYDNTFSNATRARINIQRAVDGGNKVCLVFVYKSLTEAVIGAIERAIGDNGRIERPEQMARTHLASQKAFMMMAAEFIKHPLVTLAALDYTDNHGSLLGMKSLEHRLYTERVAELEDYAIAVANAHLKRHPERFSTAFAERVTRRAYRR